MDGSASPAPVPAPHPPQLVWEELDTRWIPNDEFHVVNHYDQPVLSAQDWRLAIDGLVRHPRRLSLADLKVRPRRDVEFTLECSGNTGFPFVSGFVGNAIWAGAELASLLKEADVLDEATEVVFWGADRGRVTIRDNSGVLGGGNTGVVVDDGEGGLDLTITEQFARSMSLKDALGRANLLCYEMNGEPLPAAHGFPVRLIAPGWYGVANVKWLTRIQVVDRRYQGRFMARDYVTIRELEDPNDQVVWTITSVGLDRLKSAPAKVVRRDGWYTIIGVAWALPSAASRSRSTIGSGRLRRCTAASHVIVAHGATPGDSGRLTGGRPHRDHTRLRPARLTSTGTSSRSLKTPSLPRGGRSGRTTGRSPGGSPSPRGRGERPEHDHDRWAEPGDRVRSRSRRVVPCDRPVGRPGWRWRSRPACATRLSARWVSGRGRSARPARPATPARRCEDGVAGLPMIPTHRAGWSRASRSTGPGRRGGDRGAPHPR